ncbi:MAG: MBOAT family O-acyltransferase [Kiritimatiellia bacterium]
MLFPTTAFAVFFALVFFLHWALISRSGPWKIFILIASYFFYGFWSWKFVFMLGGFTIVNHAAAVLIHRAPTGAPIRRRLIAWICVFDLGMLAFFKYFGFLTLTAFQFLAALGLQVPEGPMTATLELAGKIVLPVGISFFTFQGLSYVIDVYRNEIKPGKTLLDFAVYLSFFPQLVAGPIVRAIDLLPQMERPPTRRMPLDTGRAACLILGGLFKKIVVANFLAGHMADPVFTDPGSFNAPDAILGVWAYALQIYCDFSAYSDIAIGVSLLMGFHFPINFNAPYLATSMQDFWHRWHISLSTWLRDYVFIPLGGSRAGDLITYRNLILTFLLGGLWHGAGWTFILWGAFHGLFLAAERLFRRIRQRPIGVEPTGLWAVSWRRIWVFQWVCVSWVFFRSQSMEDVATLFQSLGNWSGPVTLGSPLFLLALAAGWLIQFMDGTRLEAAWNRFSRFPAVLQGAVCAAILAVILGLGPRGVAPFIYFQF